MKTNLCVPFAAAFMLAGADYLAADDSVKLSGNVIGTTECVDYDHANALTTTVNTAANLFDGDLTTYFATYQRNEGWAGLDLGAKHVITKVRYCPRMTWSDRVMLGVFEGANNPDFGDAIPLCVIPEGAPENTLTERAVNCSRGFRYVRYIGPRDVRCNIAELEFYGYSSDGDDSHVGQVTNLPTVAIHTTNNAVIDSKEQYVKGIISVIDGSDYFTDSLEIRGRGNASWGFPKKPYRVKLFNKASLLHNPAKEKNWTLINNYGDKTLMRNLVAFHLSQQLDMAYTPAGKPVDVVLNGEYVGCYQLCDHMEVATGRVETDKMKETDVAMPELSGGYLVEIDAYAYSEDMWFESSPRRVPVTIKYPKDDEIAPAQATYIRNHFNSMERALFASDYTDPASGFRRYIDVPSFVRHFLVGELSGNTDTYWSVYMSKKRGDDRFYFGPVWDFDIAFDNDNRTYPVNNNYDWLCISTGSAANGMRDFVGRWLSDPALMAEIKKVYANYRDDKKLDADSLLKLVNDYASQMDASQQLNFKRWNIMNSYVHQNPEIRGSYHFEVENLKNFLRGRIAWMDRKLQYVPGVSNMTASEVSVYADNGALHVRHAEAVLITVFDISGRQILSVESSGGDYTLPRGLYFVRVGAPRGQNKTFKVML